MSQLHSESAIIRFASPEDAAAIREVHVAAGKGPDSLERNNQDVLQWLDSRIPSDYLREMDSEHFVVAEVAGRLVGFGALNPEKQEITSVYVEPASTRRGVASALVFEMEQEAVRRGIGSLALQAAGGALCFYEKQGYCYSTKPSKDGPLWADMHKKLL